MSGGKFLIRLFYNAHFLWGRRAEYEHTQIWKSAYILIATQKRWRKEVHGKEGESEERESKLRSARSQFYSLFRQTKWIQQKLFNWRGQIKHFSWWKWDAKSQPTEAARDWKERQTEPRRVWLGRRRHSAASSLKRTLFWNRHWKWVCTEQMERRAGDRRTDENSYFDKLRFGEPDGCYETHSVFKGRLKRSLDHSFETVPGTVRHWRRANTDTTDEFRAKETRLRPFLHASAWLTIIQGLEVSDELDVFVHRRLFGVDGASEHVAAELQLIFC